MNDETMAGLVAWVGEMGVGEIRDALAASAAASSIRDVDTLARYLFAKANNAI